jgi:hypothetical protein
MISLKKCNRCLEEFPTTREYFYTSKRNNDNLTYICIKCTKKKVKKWREENDEYNKKKKRIYHLETTYGITIDEYNKFFEQQKGRCKICGKHQKNFKNALHVDHDHKTGKIRGLLCGNCNRTLGYFNENPLIFIKMAKYVRNEC